MSLCFVRKDSRGECDVALQNPGKALPLVLARAPEVDGPGDVRSPVPVLGPGIQEEMPVSDTIMEVRSGIQLI